ncbi:hypothetical protein GY14_19340 [Delftia tsuruhatensis]|nr:hypothetical protein GY14_19340 [Delftia tsuruhatensis]
MLTFPSVAAGRLAAGAGLADHHLLAGLQPRQHLGLGVGAQAHAHLALGDLALGIAHAHAVVVVGIAAAQRGGRHEHGLVGLGHAHGDLGGHGGAQLAFRVGHVELGVVVDGLGGLGAGGGRCASGGVRGDGGGRRLYALDRGGVALAATAQRGEPDRLAQLDLVHVGLGNLGANGHHVELGQHDDGGRGLEGVQGLALLGDHRHDHAVHGRDDAGVAQVDALGLHLGACLLDLCLKGADIGQRGVQRSLGGFMVGSRGGVGLQQFLLALEGEPGLDEGRAPRGQLGLQGGDGCLGIAQLDALRLGIDFGDQVAGLDLLAQLHVQAPDLARDLGAHGHQFLGVQPAHGQHGLLQVADGDGCGCELGGGLGTGLPPHQACDHACACDGDHGPFAIELHSSPAARSAAGETVPARRAPDARTYQSGAVRCPGIDQGWRFSGEQAWDTPETSQLCLMAGTC